MRIATLKNITKVAKEMYVSQPYLSKVIHSLEQELGQTLFDRNSNGMELTAAGKLYRNYLLDIRKRKEKLLQDLSILQGSGFKRITLGASAWYSELYLATLLHMIRDMKKNIHLDVIENLGERIDMAFIAGKLDCAIMSPPFDDLWKISAERLHIKAIPISQGCLDIVLPKSFLPLCGLDPARAIPTTDIVETWNPEEKRLPPEKKRSYIPLLTDLTPLRNLPLITSVPGKRLHEHAMVILQKYELIPSDIIRISSITNEMDLTRSGIGYTIMPEEFLYYLGDKVKDTYVYRGPVVTKEWSWDTLFYYHADAVNPSLNELLPLIEKL